MKLWRKEWCLLNGEAAIAPLDEDVTVSEVRPRLGPPWRVGGRKLPHELLDELLDDRGLLVWAWVRAAGYAPLVADVAKAYGITIAMLVGRRRHVEIAHARHELWLRVAVARSGASLVELGRVFRVHVGSVRHGLGVAMALHPCPDCAEAVSFDGNYVRCAERSACKSRTIGDALERWRRKERKANR